jgi:tyrosine-protein phosphatase SIW14
MTVPLNHRLGRMRISAAVLAAALSVGSSAFAQTDRVAKAVAGLVDISKIRIDNFGRIDQNFYRGAQPKDSDYTDLAALGIKTLINLTSDDRDASEEALAKKAGLKYVNIPMTTRVAPTPAEIASFLKIVSDPASQPIYVHCVGGRHRTGVMTAIYRMTHDGWSPDQAFKEMKQYKFGADFLHPEFKQFVYSYGATLANAAAASPAATSKPAAGGR